MIDEVLSLIDQKIAEAKGAKAKAPLPWRRLFDEVRLRVEDDKRLIVTLSQSGLSVEVSSNRIDVITEGGRGSFSFDELLWTPEGEKCPLVILLNAALDGRAKIDVTVR